MKKELLVLLYVIVVVATGIVLALIIPAQRQNVVNQQTTTMEPTEQVPEVKTHEPPIRTYPYNDSENLFLSFRFGMSRQEYQNERRRLIQSEKLQLWDGINYYFVLFSVTNVLGTYSEDNHFFAELRFPPTFNNDKLTSWKILIWPLFGDDVVSPNNKRSVIDYLTNICGEPLSVADGKYIWKKLELAFESTSNGPYGYEVIPVITYRMKKQ